MAVGQIVGLHGLHGEVKVEVHTDYPERFDVGSELLLGEQLRPVQVQSSRPHKTHQLVRFRGINGRDAAEALRNLWLFVHEDEAAELDDDSYWIHDIVGLQAVTVEGRVLGTVSDVMATGANDVYIVQPVAGVNRERELLLPAIGDVVQRVELENERIIVALPDGLLDDGE